MLDPRPRATGRAPLEDTVLEVATVLRALKTGVEELKAHYLSLPAPPQEPITDRSTGSRPSVNRSTGLLANSIGGGVPGRFPRWRIFESKSGQKCEIKYVRRIPKDMDKAVFLAKMIGDGDIEKDVVVKFTYSYSPEVHSLLARKEHAPRLHYAEFQDSLEDSDGPGMWVVVMELVENATHLSGSPSEGQKSKLKTVLRILAEEQVVHGDLRLPNILVRGEDLFVIDFDWSGKVGEVKYPLHINLEGQKHWHSGVLPGRLIEHAHDRHRVDVMIKGEKFEQE